MKIKLMRSLTFLVFMSFWKISLPTDAEVSCVVKQSCILPCSFQSLGEPILHWTQLKSPELRVHSFYSNQDQLGHQDQNFRGRTSLFLDQVSRGNASLLLRDVQLQDEGRYNCYTSTTEGYKGLIIRLNVDAPVSDIRIHQDGNRITCSSEGIYPQPELTWSTEPPSNMALQNRTTVHQTEEKLYDISSSLTGPDGPDLTYSCSIRTRRNQRRATFRELSVAHAPYRTTTLHCSDSNWSAASLVWRFNDQIILSQTEPSGGHSVTEAWRKHVKAVTASGGLTLRGLTAQQEGLYSCEMSNEEEAVISGTMLNMQKHPVPGSSWVPAAVGAAAAVASLTGTSAFLLLRFLKSQRTV
ncbi:programmed cell death 1 ligand 1-like isoform X3 [Poecilia formosa]|uniref:programmed cell death 1 ligand 1-like isoform X3 n=1 Tax=Poecilia formosa TaxID=48698 RepID=UPI0007B8AF8B|nr:PREDICTED: programmed cell death 1 ligand 1-like isoform X3 [Poecilia formosa]